MAELKTKRNEASVAAFLASITDPVKQRDCLALLDLIGEWTGLTPEMWGASIVGYGQYHYKSDSGREGDWFLTGFSPRKKYLTVYILSGFSPYEALLERLGKHKTSKGCLYINRLADIDVAVLKTLVTESVSRMADGRHD